MGQTDGSLLGALRVQKELEIPAIGGKDSMSGTFMDIDVPPTLASLRRHDYERERGSFHRAEGSRQHTGLTAVRSTKESSILIFIARPFIKVRSLTAAGKVSSRCAIGRGGLFMSLVKMAVGNKIGVSVKIRKTLALTVPRILVLELDAGEQLQTSCWGIRYEEIGKTEEPAIEIKGISMNLDDIIAKWQQPLESIFPVRTAEFRGQDTERRKTSLQSAIPRDRRSRRQDRVVIPAFPGTNCEDGLRENFERAGAPRLISTSSAT